MGKSGFHELQHWFVYFLNFVFLSDSLSHIIPILSYYNDIEWLWEQMFLFTHMFLFWVHFYCAIFLPFAHLLMIWSWCGIEDWLCSKSLVKFCGFIKLRKWKFVLQVTTGCEKIELMIMKFWSWYCIDVLPFFCNFFFQKLYWLIF